MGAAKENNLTSKVSCEAIQEIDKLFKYFCEIGPLMIVLHNNPVVLNYFSII